MDMNTNTKFHISYEAHDELFGMIEDSVEYFCSENMISGEAVWTVIEAMAQAKLNEFKDM